MKNLTDVKYATVTYSGDNSELTILVKLEVSKKTFDISTFEDLLIMRDHIYGSTERRVDAIPATGRTALRYRLLNDIDCEGRLWTPVSYLYNNGLTADAFCSEFDGQGYTISNYKITEEVFDFDAAKGQGGGMLFVGFFGYVNNGGQSLDVTPNIHDFTLDNVTVKLDAKEHEACYTNGDATLAIYAGLVIGRLDAGNAQNCGRVNLYNVTVKNSTLDIDAYKQFVGGIIGDEEMMQSYVGVRKNLNVIDCSIYAISSKGGTGTGISLGGLVGRIKGNSRPDASTPDAEATYWLRYNDCTVQNIKIGFNYEGWLAAEEADKAGYLHVTGGNIDVGIFAGILTTNITFANCSVNGYELARTAPSSNAVYGLYGGAANDVVLKNITVQQNENWDNPHKGIYGFGVVGDSGSGLPELIDEEEIIKVNGQDSPHAIWTSGSAEPDWVTEILDKHE